MFIAFTCMVANSVLPFTFAVLMRVHAQNQAERQGAKSR